MPFITITRDWWDKRRRQKLLQKLRLAAKYLNNNTIMDDHYAIVAIEVLSKLSKPKKGKLFGLQYHPVDFVQLTWHTLPAESRNEREFGPISQAVTMLKSVYASKNVSITDQKTGNFVWGVEAGTLLKATNIRLARLTQVGWAVERWWKEQKELFPILSEPIVKLMILIISYTIPFVFGLIIGKSI